jgi:tetratricopeptide (TPR) repeat protein
MTSRDLVAPTALVARRRARLAPAALAALLAALLAASGCAGGAAAPRSAGDVPLPPPPAAAAPPSARAERLFADALRAQEDQRKLAVPTDWALLERKWREVVDAGDLAEAHYNLGVTLAEQGRSAEARAEYERALAAKPSLRQAAVNAAVLLEREGDARGAAAAYARVLRDFPEDAVARGRLAALYQGSGQLDEAWRLAREALQRDPRSLAAHVVLAKVALARKDPDLAKLVVMRAQRLDPKSAELAWLEGEVLSRQGDAPAAADRWRRALTLDAGFRPARVALFEAALDGQQWSAVAEHGNALLAADPSDARLHLAVGIALRHLERPDEALARYDEAERRAGGALPEVYLARGVLQMRVKSECEAALASFQAYARAAGPVLPPGAQVTKLQRECEGILEQNRLAAEAARQMKAEAERKGAQDAADKAPAPGAAGPADGGAKPTSAPVAR